MNGRGRARGRSRGRGGGANGQKQVSFEVGLQQGMAAMKLEKEHQQQQHQQHVPPHHHQQQRQQQQQALAQPQPVQQLDPRTTGTTGSPVALLGNYVNLIQFRGAFCSYTVSFEPEIGTPRARRGILHGLKEEIGHAYVFDGMSCLYLPNKLDEVSKEFVALRREGEVKIQIKLTGEVPMHSAAAFPMLNSFIKQMMLHQNAERIGRHYFVSDLAVHVQRHGLQVLPGYVTAIEAYGENLMLNMDLVSKLVHTSSVLQQIRGLQQRQILQKLLGRTVITRYNNKTYRIDDINFGLNPQSIFETTSRKFRQPDSPEKVEISFAYDLTITDMQQPLLMSRPRKKHQEEGFIHLIPEFCSLTGLDEAARNDFHMMKDLASHTKVEPRTRFQRLQEFIDKVNQDPALLEKMKPWGVEFAPKLMSITGRVLPPENIKVGNNKVVSYDPSRAADWGMPMRMHRLLAPRKLLHWVLVCGHADQNHATEFNRHLTTVTSQAGIELQQPIRKLLERPIPVNYIRAIREANNEAGGTSETAAGLDMVVCILPSRRKDVYDAIKKLCCLELGVVSQCVCVRPTLNNPSRLKSVVTSVTYQMNAKLGGSAWSVEVPLKDLMVVGIDTYHSPGGNNSCAALVCSINEHHTQYFAQTYFQPPKQEMLDSLETGLAGGLRCYKQRNHRLPQKIIVYRDGVGEGMVEALKAHEIDQMKRAMDRVYTSEGKSLPSFAVIVVVKRNNTRFVVKQGLRNPIPGTVVDTVVTKPEWPRYDFFIVPQTVRQGSVSPLHCLVVEDTSGLNPDKMQRLTYKMCHIYQNLTSTIAVPAPCMNAHKAAYLGGESLHAPVTANLSDQLYYL